jgi:hypothetical protein
MPPSSSGIAFTKLRKGLADPSRPDLCDPLRRPLPV